HECSLETLLRHSFGQRTLPTGIGPRQHERGHARSVMAVKLLCQKPTPRDSDQMRALDAGEIEQAGQSVRPITDSEGWRRVLRLAGARRVPGDNGELIG